MADWAPNSGCRILTSGLATITAPATPNTKPSSFTQLVVVPASGVQYVGLSVISVLTLDFNTQASFLVDIAVGGAGSEAVLVADVHWAGVPDQPLFLNLPIGLPPGTRVSARAASDVALANISANLQVIGAGFDQAVPKCAAVTYGAVAADSGGTSVDPGATINTDGAWQEVTVPGTGTTLPHTGLSFFVGNQNNPAPAGATWLVDIGIGAAGSETQQVSNFRLVGTTAGNIGPTPSPVYPVSIPLGSRIAVRTQCSTNDATDRLLDFVVVGYS